MKALRFPFAVAFLLVVFLADIAFTPREIILIPFYFIPVVLAAAFARPMQVVAIYVAAVALGVVAALHNGLLPGLDYTVRLAGLSGVAMAAVIVAARFRRESARRALSEERSRRDEQEALKQKAVLSTVLENTQAHVYMKDASGRYLYVNGEVEKQLGRPRDQILGRTNEELLPPEVARKVSEFDREVFNRGGVVEREERVPEPSGSEHVFLSRKMLVRRPGEADCLVGISSDITVQKKTERDLRIIVENSFDVVMQIDSAGVIVWSTPAVAMLAGWHPDQLAGRRLLEFIHPDDSDAAGVLLQNLWKGVAGNLDVRLKRRMGGFRWVNLSLRRPPGDGEEFSGCIATWHDMEAEIQAREAVEAERSRLRATLDALVDPHVLLRPRRDSDRRIADFVFADANPAACACCKMERGQLVGKALPEVFAGLAFSGLMAMCRDVMESGHPLALNDLSDAREPQGEGRHLDFRATRVGDALSLTWRDVTERHAPSRAAAES